MYNFERNQSLCMRNGQKFINSDINFVLKLYKSQVAVSYFEIIKQQNSISQHVAEMEFTFRKVCSIYDKACKNHIFLTQF